jgi:ABC-type dipeptide/oligopeptide/nickel transport system permease component
MAYALRRVFLTIPLLLAVSLVVFLVGEALPGDPAQIRFEKYGTVEEIAAWKQERGLDRPLHERYVNYVAGVVTELDFGASYKNDYPIGKDLIARFTATFELTLFAMLIAVPIGLLAGIVSASRRGRWEDYAGNVFALAGISVPVFWLGIMLTLLFSMVGYTWIGGRYDEREWDDVIATFSTNAYFFEAIARGQWGAAASCGRYLLVPGIALATIPMAVITRMTRSSMLEETGKDYVRTAHAKGLHRARVVMTHVLRNALIPVVTITGLQFGALLSGAVLTETVFAWPGLGTYIVEGVLSNDSPKLVGSILLVATIFIVVNLLVDLLYGVIDPRVRVGGGR